MRAVGFMTLHYGLTYAAAAIESVIEDIDALWCIYTPTPTFGFQTDAVCPDHARDLYNVCKEAAGRKFHWYAASPHQFKTEGEHCDFIYQLAPRADVVVRVDADEVWQTGLLAQALEYMRDYETVKDLRLPMAHAWRSFSRWVLNDPAFPVRVKRQTGRRDVTLTDAGRIFHFGYAERAAVVAYKERITAHRNEWRANWFEQTFMPNRLNDVHPTMIDRWHPQEADPYALGLPDYMRSHPLANVEVIE